MKNEIPIMGCASIGGGITMLSMSACILVTDYTRFKAITEKYYSLQEKITPEIINNLETTLESVASNVSLLGYVSCTSIGAGLLAAGIYRLIKGPEEFWVYIVK